MITKGKVIAGAAGLFAAGVTGAVIALAVSSGGEPQRQPQEVRMVNDASTEPTPEASQEPTASPEPAPTPSPRASTPQPAPTPKQACTRGAPSNSRCTSSPIPASPFSNPSTRG